MSVSSAKLKVKVSRPTSDKSVFYDKYDWWRHEVTEVVYKWRPINANLADFTLFKQSYVRTYFHLLCVRIDNQWALQPVCNLINCVAFISHGINMSRMNAKSKCLTWKLERNQLFVQLLFPNQNVITFVKKSYFNHYNAFEQNITNLKL